MGIPGVTFYGEDLGSAIQNAEKIIAKIKTNKYDKTDLNDLKNVLESIYDEIEKIED